MEFKFSCPNCGQHITASSEEVGVHTACPTCSSPLDIPAPKISHTEYKVTASPSSLLAAQPSTLTTKPCPTCGGQISVTTKKCLRCGKDFDVSLRVASKRGYTDIAEVPFYREQWFFWLMYFTFTPIALGLLVSGDIYYQKNEVVQSFGLANRVVAGIIGLIYLLASAPSQGACRGRRCLVLMVFRICVFEAMGALLSRGSSRH